MGGEIEGLGVPKILQIVWVKPLGGHDSEAEFLSFKTIASLLQKERNAARNCAAESAYPGVRKLGRGGGCSVHDI